MHCAINTSVSDAKLSTGVNSTPLSADPGFFEDPPASFLVAESLIDGLELGRGKTLERPRGNWLFDNSCPSVDFPGLPSCEN